MSSPNSSIPAVVDALVALMTGIADAPAAVYDGAENTNEPDVYAIIGGTIDPVVDGDMEWGSIGRPPAVTYEEYEVHVEISYLQHSEDLEGVQKIVRDGAFLIFNEFKAAIQADPTLGQICMWALPGKLGLIQTAAGDAEIATGRRADIPFVVRVRNRMQ
ncbi:MAG TPA: hypothetical protein VGL75_07315 [Acidothermaceae bacterium]